jgi:5-methylcytosine-specific restriction enzyme B
MLEAKLAQELGHLYRDYVDQGRIRPQSELQGYYRLFRQRFGPDMLSGLDGEALLYFMHGRRDNRDSLVYWLEFKDDDEFPSPALGSIAGGSSLKFGLYERHETGGWRTGSAQHQIDISTVEAAKIARTQRDELLLAAQLLEELPLSASDTQYAALQNEMTQVAPHIATASWGHKYLSLLYPDKLDDFHNPWYQRFHLIKLLQTPPAGDGRFDCAGIYVRMAVELGMPVYHLTTLLWRRNGEPHRYWRLRIDKSREADETWIQMARGGFVGLPWEKLGDLSDIEYKQESKDSLRSRMAQAYPGRPADIGSNTQLLFNFLNRVEDGDLVLACSGATVRGIGKINGAYTFVGSHPLAHRRSVEWLSFNEWPEPNPPRLPDMFREIKDVQNMIEAERRLLGAKGETVPTPPPPPPQLLESAMRSDTDGARTIPIMRGIPGRIQSILERKRQVILYGPPGTGKTYWALSAARELSAYAAFGNSYTALSPDQRTALTGDAGLVRMCSFHPAYSYEDFLEGYRPVAGSNGQLAFERRDGIFKRLCQDALKQPNRRFYLLIDEINRGDIPRIFGELLTVIERDKRGRYILLPISGERFAVPDNVCVIGTMNTADRSIALLDTALRRRFGFVELMPDSSVLGDAAPGGVPLGPWLDAINNHIVAHIGRDARNLQVGHAYLLEGGKPVTDFARFARIVQDDIIPLLEEYCYEDYEALGKILGRGFIDAAAQRVRHELFEPERRDELIQALLAVDPEIVTSPQALAAEANFEEEERDAGDADDAGSQAAP